MSASSDETIPQIALFIQESSVRPPPPPQASSSLMPRTSSWVPRPMGLPMQHLLPPPPPPPPAVPSTSTSQIHNTVYRAQSPQPSTSFAICHPPPVPVFDARRPPPPIHVQQHNNILKRPLANSCTASSSKLRKLEGPKGDDEMCDVCMQREISIEKYRIKMEKISIEDECQTMLFKKKLSEYQRQKDLLQSLVDSDMFRKVEEFVEDVPQYNFRSVLNNLNESFLTGVSSSIPNQMLLQIMEYFFSSKMESSPSMRVEDSLRQTLSTMSRAPVSRSNPDLLQTLRDMLYNEDRSSSSERLGSNELSLEQPHSSIANGGPSFRRYSNGQRVEPRAPPPPAPLPQPAPAPPLPAPVAPPAPPAPPLAVTYPHYPPPRPYYPPPYPPGPRPSTSRAPRQQYPPDANEQYPPPYHY